jgi:hypothetical protein
MEGREQAEPGETGLRTGWIGRASRRSGDRYDFTTAPHAGRLGCERDPLGLKGKQWRQLAADALRDLRLPRFY